MDDHDLLLSIQELLDGTSWTPATLDLIADLLNQNGYRIRDFNDASPSDPDLSRD
jgi:hypothetical protein